jgi:hypothetical protein
LLPFPPPLAPSETLQPYREQRAMVSATANTWATFGSSCTCPF